MEQNDTNYQNPEHPLQQRDDQQLDASQDPYEDPYQDPNYDPYQDPYYDPQQDPYQNPQQDQNPQQAPYQNPQQDQNPQQGPYQDPQQDQNPQQDPYYNQPQDDQQNQNQVAILDQQIERTQNAIFIMVFMQVFITLVSSELCCLYLRICHTSEDIDVAPYASHSLIPLLAISLVLSIGSYEATELVLHDMLKLLRLLSIIWAVIMISLSIAVFISGMILAEDEYREDTWNRLTPLGKEYYDDDQDNLADAYRINMTLIMIFQLICAVLLLGIGIADWVLYSKAQFGYLPRIRNKVYVFSVQEQLPQEQQPLMQDSYLNPQYSGQNLEEQQDDFNDGYQDPYQDPNADPYQDPNVDPYQDPYEDPYADPYADPNANPYTDPYADSYGNPHQQNDPYNQGRNPQNIEMAQMGY